jgi:hypothetical protein
MLLPFCYAIDGLNPIGIDMIRATPLMTNVTAIVSVDVLNTFCVGLIVTDFADNSLSLTIWSSAALPTFSK